MMGDVIRYSNENYDFVSFVSFISSLSSLSSSSSFVAVGRSADAQERLMRQHQESRVIALNTSYRRQP